MKEYKMSLNKPYFIYTGNAYPHKNLDKTVKAIVKLNSEGYKVDFYIVSARNVFIKRLEKLVSKLNAQNCIKLLGFVTDEKLQKLYEKSVGFIYPSLSEGFGLPGLEAMKASTLLICSDIPVFREIYGNHAIYFNPLSIDSMQKALIKSLSLTKVQARKMILDNKIFIKRYSWTKMAKETLQVYNSLK